MEIVKNKGKLTKWLKAEDKKITNMLPSKTIEERRLLSRYSNLIRESRDRLRSSNYEPNVRNIFSNNKNWMEPNFNGIRKAVPLILVSNKGEYLGHVWANGNGPNASKRPTGHFQGIQKSVNLINNKSIRVAPVLLKAAENHLRNLGYTAMSTHWPMGKMFEIMRTSPNWTSMGSMVYKRNI